MSSPNDPETSDPDDPKHRTTVAPRAAVDANADADRDLLALVYDDLRNVANRLLASERKSHTLQPTALVHEAWLRLATESDLHGSDEAARGRFLAHASQAMRRILIDHARSRLRAKRGGGAQKQSFSDSMFLNVEDPVSTLDLDSALTDFAAIKPRAAKIAELRIYAGLTTAEAGRVVAASLTTAKAEWALARAYLSRRVQAEK
ncbi:MAG: ECF-type sigma factor [Planctomycetota bacterium]